MTLVPCTKYSTPRGAHHTTRSRALTNKRTLKRIWLAVLATLLRGLFGLSLGIEPAPAAGGDGGGAVTSLTVMAGT